jgi:hypothetical protein
MLIVLQACLNPKIALNIYFGSLFNGHFCPRYEKMFSALSMNAHWPLVRDMLKRNVCGFTVVR